MGWENPVVLAVATAGTQGVSLTENQAEHLVTWRYYLPIIPGGVIV